MELLQIRPGATRVNFWELLVQYILPSFSSPNYKPKIIS